MSAVVARRIASTPTRTAAETWERIVEILAPDPDSGARMELAKATGVACASISSEATKDAAIVVWGGTIPEQSGLLKDPSLVLWPRCTCACGRRPVSRANAAARS